MTHRSWCKRKRQRRASRRLLFTFSIAILAWLVADAPPARASDDAPQWMRALADAPLPPHDEDTDAILLYAEKNVNLQSAGNLKISVRRAYKILRPNGRGYGYVAVSVEPHKKVAGLRAWCIPATGKDYQVKDKEAVEMSLSGVANSELFSDVKERVIRIPAADPGSIVGYEYETEEQPLILQDVWDFQERIPVRESRYSVELPSGWTYLSKWANYPEVKPSQAGNNRWQWAISDIKQIPKEEDMPPLQGVSGQMIVYFVPPGESAANAFTDWRQMGNWYSNLTAARLDGSADLKQSVASTTGASSTTLAKMQAIAQFVQHNFRYVAIELGVGGFQPHAASEVFAHRYGDCKDKATLTIAMLREVGVESYYVLVNIHRGAVTQETPPHVHAFNHAIVAIRLPSAVTDPSLVAVLQHPKYGRLLLFDPTNELTPLGQIGSYLQASYGLLVTPDGGELVQLPTQPPAMNSIQRTAKLNLDSAGTLKGDVSEVRVGDRARAERAALRDVTSESDRIKPIETMLSGSLTNFRVSNAAIVNLNKTDLPFGFNYSLEAPNYAKLAGNLVLVRPRVIGVKARGIAKTKQARLYPFEFSGVLLETDSFDITIPPGYDIDDLPPAADADYSFASYHSTTAVQGGTIHYHRTYEIKQLSVPVDQAEQVKNFYALIAGDERSMVVLKPAAR